MRENAIIVMIMIVTKIVAVVFTCAQGAGTGRAPFACDPTRPDTKTLPFCRRDLGSAERVGDLIRRLILQEKVGLLVNKAAAVPRLGIMPYEWWSEALHGVSNTGFGITFAGQFPGATSFPQVITTAATFNASLWETIGKVVSDEARAMYNGGMAGLTFWSPNVNIFRDPRWGRGQETPGEDPLVASVYAVRYVRGLQGGDVDRLKVAACCKHYTAYDLDNWAGVDRFHFNAKVSEQDLKDTFQIPFKSCVKEGKVASVMCSYNQVNGIPTCADPKLLRKTVRGAWRLNGYIVSDCESVRVLYEDQHYTPTPEAAAAVAIKAGLDLDCGSFLASHAESAVQRGLVNESDINGALANTLTVQMRLGMFDGEPSAQPYGNLGPKDVCSPNNQELALDAARQGIVLLKNDGPVLPLSPQRLTEVAVIGPNSNATTTMIGNYAGVPCEYTTPLQGIGKYVRTTIHHEQGCADVGCADDALFGGAIRAASQVDATILVMGLDQSIEAEFRDRAGLLLPGLQQELISKVASASKSPIVLVLMSGGPIDVSFAQNDAKIGAIVWAGYPGQAGGAAIADVLFGTHNPGGKLPMTWYPQEYLNNLAMTTMAMRPNPSENYPGRTYRFYRGRVLYKFGHGLSYTSFVTTITDAPKVVRIPVKGGHRWNTTTKLIRVSHTICKGLRVRVRMDVENTGPRDGSHTLIVYSSTPIRVGWAPVKQVIAFEKVSVRAGGRQGVEVSINACKHMSVVDRAGVRRIPMGEHALRFGDDDVTHVVLLEAQRNSRGN